MAGPDAAPVYESTLRVPEGPRPALQPIEATVGSTAAIGKAVAELGNAGVDFSAKLLRSQQEADDASIKSQYLEGISTLRDQYVKSQDYQTAPAQFEEGRATLERNLSGQVLDTKRRADLQLYFTVHGLEADKAVKRAALANQSDDYRAGTAERLGEYARKIAAAGSDVERQALIDERNTDIENGVQAGWFTRVEGAQLKAGADITQDETGARQLIAADPARAVNALMDPSKFPWLGPLKRQELLQAAQASQDNRARLELQNRAQVDPASAIAGAGRVADIDRASEPLFGKIIQLESGGKNLPPNEFGATGPAQIKISTARDVLKGQGRDDLAALDDNALAAKLNENEGALSKSLGFAYFRQQLARYQGLGSQVAAAVVAYQAGPGAADKWIKDTIAKAGPNFTPAQLLEVIKADPAQNARETEKYLPNFLNAVRADLNGPILTPEGQLHAAVAVDAALKAQDAEKRRIIDSVADGSWITNSPIPMLKDGITPDPTQEAAFVQSQRAAALAGSNEAAKRLREYSFARELLPFVQQAMTMAPAQLQDFVTGMEAQLRDRPATPDEFSRLTAAKRVLATMIEKRDSDPISLIEQAGLVAPDHRVVINPSGAANDPAFLRALVARGGQAQLAISRFNGSGSALKPQEQEALAARFKNAEANEQFQLLEAFGKTLHGQPFNDTIAAVTGDKQGAPIVANLVRSRPDLAREVLDGMKLLAQKTVQEKNELLARELNASLKGLVWPDPKMQDAAVRAAAYLDLARRASRGTLYTPGDVSGFRQALEDVGGKLIKLNGLTTPLPRGMTEGQFHRLIDNLKETDLDLFGGAYYRGGPAKVESNIKSANPFAPYGLADILVLKPLSVGGDLYLVGRRNYASSDGMDPIITFGERPGPLVVNLRTIWQRIQQRGEDLTVYERGRQRFRGAQWERLRQDTERAQSTP